MYKEEELVKDLNAGIQKGLHANAPGAGMIWNSIAHSTGPAWMDALQEAIWTLLEKGYVITKPDQK